MACRTIAFKPKRMVRSWWRTEVNRLLTPRTASLRTPLQLWLSSRSSTLSHVFPTFSPPSPAVTSFLASAAAPAAASAASGVNSLLLSPRTSASVVLLLPPSTGAAATAGVSLAATPTMLSLPSPPPPNDRRLELLLFPTPKLPFMLPFMLPLGDEGIAPSNGGDSSAELLASPSLFFFALLGVLVEVAGACKDTLTGSVRCGWVTRSSSKFAKHPTACLATSSSLDCAR
mmetsp:Transcript_73894/g.139658  ORF Transcript_73894/g.139658 Transcript_73894/m.139658 type:complete len:230 (-) Transcript_73894:232-921(-)